MWNPHEIRKLIAQLAGIALGIGGFYLIVTGVQATGRINVSSSVLSGELESGSAGLFLLFLAFLLIVLPTLWGGQSLGSTFSPASGARSTSTSNPQVRLAIVTAALIVVTFVFLFGGEYLDTRYGWAAGKLIAFAGLLSGIGSVILLIGLAGSWIESDQTQESRPKTNRAGK